MNKAAYSSGTSWSNPDYELISELGRGGMGVVYKARRLSDQSILAVKVLPRFTKPELLIRFQRETQVLAQLDHPHIVKVLDSGEHSSPFFAMEFMEGADLEKLFDDRLQNTGQPFDVKEALALLTPIAEALSYCHSQNILHRDIKLANIFVKPGGYPVLVDFGVSKQKNEQSQSGYEKTLSKSQEIVGTVAYMSPEQLSPHGDYGAMGPGTDVWSLGTALFQLLTGDFPFPAPSPIHLIVAISENPSPSLRKIRPDIPKWLDQLIRQMLSKQSADRPSMEQVAQTLRDQSLNRAQSARSYSPLLAFALSITATAAIILGFFLWQSKVSLQFKGLTPPPSYVSAKNYILKGQLNQGPATISVGDRKAVSQVDGRFELSIPLKEGVNHIEIHFSNGWGQDLERAYTIHRDTQAPAIQWSLKGVEESQGYFELEDCVSIKGKMIETWLDSLTVNKTSLVVKDGHFVIPSSVWESTPDRIVLLRARDIAGNETEQRIKVRPSILDDHESWRWASREAQDRVIQGLVARLRAPFQYLGTKDYSCNDHQYRIARFTHKRTGIELHLVPGGDFNMGIPSVSNESAYLKRAMADSKIKQLQRFLKHATPQHRVRIKPFLVGAHELTEQQWSAGSLEKSKVTPNMPKGQLNRVLLLEWLKKFPSLRLPSESEWEYAARAGTSTRYFWGDEFEERYAWYNFNSGRRIHLVTEHEEDTNAFGLSDIIGNVWELVADDYRSSYRIPSTQKPYFHPDNSEEKTIVFRGGGINNPLISASLSIRFYFISNPSAPDYGARLAASFDKVFAPKK